MTQAPISTTRLPAATHTLVCHPATPCALPLQIGVSLAVAGSENGPGLLLRYEVLGDVSHLRVPVPVAPGPADGLWQHTCFEAFVGVGGDPAYREFNFSPSGQWAAYRFSAERQRDTAAALPTDSLQPDMTLDTTPRSLCLLAWLPLHALPAPVAGQPWAIGLSAVLQTTDGQLSYWALHHPAPRPDFHHPAGRPLALALPPLPPTTAP